jgi:hypothetical protein
LRIAYRSLSRAVRRRLPGPQERQGTGTAAVSFPQLIRLAWFEEPAQMRMHVNAVGDFTLLSREGWARAGGYAELELYSFFIDALFIYEAHYIGLRETVLPYAVYHMEHGGGWKPEEEQMDDLLTRLEQRGIPSISFQQYLDWVVQMYKGKRGVLPRSKTWGYSEEQLEEQWAVRRRADSSLTRAAS